MMSKQFDQISSMIEEDKIVTYKLVGKRLGTSAAESKRLLQTFFDQNKSKLLTATYCVIGCEKQSSNDFQIFVVNEKNLAKVKSRLLTVTSQQVYSVQKVAPKDSNSIFMVDLEARDQLHTFNVAPNQSEQSQPKQQNLQAQPHPQPKLQIQTTENKSKLENKTEIGSKENKSILTNVENRKPKLAKNVKRENESQASKESKKQKQCESRQTKKETKVKAEPVKRKRRRLLSVSSSEDEDDVEKSPNEDFLSEDPLEAQPEEPIIDTKREQQQISQSYVDDDGYLVTTKIRKIVEDKTDKTDKTTKPNNADENVTSKSTTKGQKKSQQNNKQATLTSYFKKF